MIDPREAATSGGPTTADRGAGVAPILAAIAPPGRVSSFRTARHLFTSGLTCPPLPPPGGGPCGSPRSRTRRWTRPQPRHQNDDAPVIDLQAPGPARAASRRAVHGQREVANSSLSNRGRAARRGLESTRGRPFGGIPPSVPAGRPSVIPLVPIHHSPAAVAPHATGWLRRRRVWRCCTAEWRTLPPRHSKRTHISP